MEITLQIRLNMNEITKTTSTVQFKVTPDAIKEVESSCGLDSDR